MQIIIITDRGSLVSNIANSSDSSTHPTHSIRTSSIIRIPHGIFPRQHPHDAYPSFDKTREQDFDNLSEMVLHTRALGEHVGAAWQLERVMRWVPNFDHHTDAGGIRADEGGSSGLYKIRGTTVEAVVGGVFYQFGAVAAHRLFHTRVLPHLTFLLPTEYRKPAEAACKRLGGTSAPVLLPSQSSHLQVENADAASA
ncbi:unnamed protein product [Rhizoctonia solani]|uniref:RNase III domain-containing protein n=1 Tax=Rhizoctonia solani TaxID=456999 RepID=A0A8H3C5T1_9AGAM|nr:unnamed protein product [Rhizoctonia solani]